MTLEEAIESMESMISDPEAWTALTKRGSGLFFLSLLKWLRELRIYRERVNGANKNEG